MNFKQLNKASQLNIVSQLSGVKLQAMGFRHVYTSNEEVIPTGLAAVLQEHGLTKDVLHNANNGQINLIIESKDGPMHHNLAYGIHSPSNYFNIGRHGTHASESNLVINFGCRLTQAEISNTGLEDGAISGKMTIKEEDDLRDLLTTVATYITKHTENQELLTPVLQLVNGYNKALELPDSLIERIANWTSIAKTIDSLTTKITHNYSNYYANDNEEEGYYVPVPRGRNIFNVERKFAKSGFTVGYDQHAEEYTGYQVDVEYMSDSSLENGVLKISLTYKGLNPIDLSEIKLLSDMSVDEIISTIVSALNTVKLDEKWGTIVTPMIEHVTNVISDVKPFIVATL